ncbi:MAG: hypothetical protein ACREJM_00490 [Candidatus Saccharimonadales bacterium]
MPLVWIDRALVAISPIRSTKPSSQISFVDGAIKVFPDTAEIADFGRLAPLGEHEDADRRLAVHLGVVKRRDGVLESMFI